MNGSREIRLKTLEVSSKGVVEMGSAELSLSHSAKRMAYGESLKSLKSSSPEFRDKLAANDQ